jgi:glycosyltransferase involved in cell wall biosynthesis
MREESQVELLVSDNASSDGTQALVTAYQSRGAAIGYIRNETNVGADRNILNCYEHASGRYVWILSDDDLIEPGTVKRVVSALFSQRYDLVCIRCYSFEGDYSGPKPFSPIPDLELSRAEDLARHVHVFFTFISAVIINKERNSSASHRPFDSLVGTNLAQLGPFYTALNHHRRSLLIRDPLIAARGNSNVGYALYRVFGPTLADITREWIDKKATQRAIINGTIQRFFPYWIMMSRRSQASTVPENPHKVLRTCFGSEPRYWVFDYPVYALPFPLAKSWLLGVRVVNRLDTLLMNMLVSS